MLDIEEMMEMIENSEFGSECKRLEPREDYDPCIIGCWNDLDNGYRLIYSESRILEMFAKVHEMSALQAIEFFDYNVEGAYAGPGTPIYASELLDHPQETGVTDV